MIRTALAFLTAALIPAFAQAEMPAHETFARKLSAALGIQSENYSFSISGGENELTFQPNVAARTVFTVNYAGLGGFTAGVRGKPEDESAQKGKTDYQDWRFNFPYRRFNVYLFYSRHTGFYLENSSALGITQSGYALFPDLYAQNMGGSFTWVWNPEKYSLAAMDMTERQVKSGGSFLLGAAGAETIFRNSGALIPLQAKGGYEQDAEMYEGRVRSLSVKAGYGYTDVYRSRWMFSFLVNIGVGMEEIRISTPTEDYFLRKPGLTLVEGFGVAGYNGEQYFGGINAYATLSQYKAKKAQIASQLTTIGIIGGARF